MEIRGLLLKMRFFCVLSFWIFLSEIKTSTTEEFLIDGYTGQYVIISCSHVFAQNNRKYFCTDPCKDSDILVSSDWSSNGRFTLKDFMTGTFTVTITELQESDSGIYWCGVDRVGVDTFHKVNLRVYEDNSQTHTASIQELTTQTDSVSTSPTSETSTFTQLKTGLVKASSSPDAFTDEDTKAVPVYSILYAVVGLVVMLTVLAVELLCVCRYKERQTSARCASRTSTHIDNEYNSDESNTVYENYLDESANATEQKPKHETKDFKSTEDPIYQNICVNTSQADGIYTDL
ncbi:putative CMRF35-like molecule 4 [Triplophysa rosa]|uniref:CMRF35-like molecule 4 n=2 Tax=Triplophysa rosa TaxID=992332 RepID=A0A9W8C8A7_TRIRA|nr:putative CMRF35-like molecule 4 [Triplophysa rosa]